MKLPAPGPEHYVYYGGWEPHDWHLFRQSFRWTMLAGLATVSVAAILVFGYLLG